MNNLSSATNQITPLIGNPATRQRVWRVAMNACIVAMWLGLYRSVFDYLAIIFSREDFRTNQIVLVAVIVLIAFQFRQEHLQLQIDATPQLFRPALGLALVGSVFYLIVEWFVDINTISASLFGLASYGLMGLWMQPARWRQGLPAALLIVGVLPFGDHMQTFIGYPIRLATALIVRDGLSAVGVSSLGVDTILVLENGVSQVDLPCSGVKSLWTGALFLIAATWIEHRALNLRWLLVAFVFAILLFLMNLARVAILVVVGQVLGLRLAAEMIHVPLGVLGFVVSCAAALVLLRHILPSPSQGEGRGEGVRPAWLSPMLCITLLAMALAYVPRPHDGLTQPAPILIFPADLGVQPMPLMPDEIEWFTRDGAESAVRWSFKYRDLTGSMIFITSSTWRVHHRPERCFEVYGLRLNDSRTHWVNPDFPIRFVSLGDRAGENILSATYWFQSPKRTTDDYGTRIWADLSPDRERWTLVSILFDRGLDPETMEVRAFYLSLHDTVARYLEGGQSP